VEGTVQLADNRLTVGPNADVAADLAARDVLVLGKVQGNITATGRVELRAGCQLIGDIRAFRLVVEDNAGVRGKVDLTPNTKPAEAAVTATPQILAPVPAPVSGNAS
jgi:cytoskeletal protein CcmA (bactofilin family)